MIPIGENYTYVYREPCCIVGQFDYFTIMIQFTTSDFLTEIEILLSAKIKLLHCIIVIENIRFIDKKIRFLKIHHHNGFV